MGMLFYRPLGPDMAKVLRKAAPPKVRKASPSARVRWTLRQVLQEPDFAVSQDASVLLDDFTAEHFLKGREIFAPEAADTWTELVAGERFQVTLPHALVPTDMAFEVALPDPLPAVLAKANIVSGVQVVVMSHARREEVLAGAFSDHLSMNLAGSASPRVDPAEPFISLSYRCRDDDTPDNRCPATVRASLPVSRLPNALQASRGDEWAKICGSSDSPSSMALTPVELDAQLWLVQLTCALLALRAADPDGFRNGAPRGVRLPKRLKRETPISVNLGVLGDAGRDSPRAHWRQLRHERFYRGEYAAWPRGSRWVFVNAKSQEEEFNDA